MSIVERALEKNRAAGKQQPARRAGETETERARGRNRQAAAIDPNVRIRPLSVSLDLAACRERRLLVSGADTDGGAVAAYRMLRTRLLHRARASGWTTIGVTSAGPNDGKTLTALNLALSMSRDKGREIVLLDLDMRNPSVCRTLGVQPAHELSDFLESGTNAQNMFFSIGSDNLLLAGGVHAIPHASELLASPRFEELLQVVKQGLVDPIVLIDLPPVLLTDDALVVAPKIDAFMIVASEGTSGRADVSKAMNLLSDFPIAGVVLNRAAEATQGYDYGYDADDVKGASDKRV
jgi:protein-tyrosine kinase